MRRGGGGGGESGERRLSCTSLIFETWNVELTLMVRGRTNLMAVRLMIFSMGKGPTNLGASFLDYNRRGSSFEESNTLWPTSYLEAGIQRWSAEVVNLSTDLKRVARARAQVLQHRRAKLRRKYRRLLCLRQGRAEVGTCKHTGRETYQWKS